MPSPSHAVTRAGRAKSLSTLGLLKMRQAVWRAAHALRLPVHIPVYVLELHARMSRVESALEARLRREPTDAEVARCQARRAS